jgi:phage-related tail protein
MSPGEREFGELIGEVRAIAKQITDLQRNNTAEHEANSRKLERIENRIDSLEATRDKFGGAKAFLAGISSAVLLIAGYISPH